MRVICRWIWALALLLLVAVLPVAAQSPQLFEKADGAVPALAEDYLNWNVSVTPKSLNTFFKTADGEHRAALGVWYHPDRAQLETRYAGFIASDLEWYGPPESAFSEKNSYGYDVLLDEEAEDRVTFITQSRREDTIRSFRIIDDGAFMIVLQSSSMPSLEEAVRVFDILEDHAWQLITKARERLDKPEEEPAEEEPEEASTQEEKPTAETESEEPEDEGTVDTTISGSVHFDAAKSEPLRGALLEVRLYDAEGAEVCQQRTRLDDDGRFALPQACPVAEGTTAQLTVWLEYGRGGTVYFRLIDDRKAGQETVAVVSAKPLQVPEDGTIAWVAGTGRTSPEPSHVMDVTDSVIVYSALHECVRFYLDVLGVPLTRGLPVTVRAFIGDASSPAAMGDSSYDPSTQTVRLGLLDSTLLSARLPDPIYHEMSHHVMWDFNGGKWQDYPDGDLNHGGYANRSTADSWAEGFAALMPVVIKMHYGYADAHHYMTYGPLEADRKAWEEAGIAEELAIGGALYDLWDNPTRDDDAVHLTLEQLWGVLDHYHPDLASFYDELVATFPGERAAIDDVFVAHGLFTDLGSGDGAFQPGEPFLDANGNRSYDAATERFVDATGTSPSGEPSMTYQPGAAVGRAAYALTPERRSQPVLPGHFVKTTSDAEWFELTVVFPDRPESDYAVRVPNLGGMLYTPVPSRAYATELTLAPENGEGEPLTFTGEAFGQAYDRALADGYYVQHSFEPGASSPRLNRTLLLAIGLLMLGVGLLALGLAVLWLRRGRRRG
jgi:hypothetical protein